MAQSDSYSLKKKGGYSTKQQSQANRNTSIYKALTLNQLQLELDDKIKEKDKLESQLQILATDKIPHAEYVTDKGLEFYTLLLDVVDSSQAIGNSVTVAVSFINNLLGNGVINDNLYYNGIYANANANASSQFNLLNNPAYASLLAIANNGTLYDEVVKNRASLLQLYNTTPASQLLQSSTAELSNYTDSEIITILNQSNLSIADFNNIFYTIKLEVMLTNPNLNFNSGDSSIQDSVTEALSSLQNLNQNIVNIDNQVNQLNTQIANLQSQISDIINPAITTVVIDTGSLGVNQGAFQINDKWQLVQTVNGVQTVITGDIVVVAHENTTDIFTYTVHDSNTGATWLVQLPNGMSVENIIANNPMHLQLSNNITLADVTNPKPQPIPTTSPFVVITNTGSLGVNQGTMEINDKWQLVQTVNGVQTVITGDIVDVAYDDATDVFTYIIQDFNTGAIWLVQLTSGMSVENIIANNPMHLQLSNNITLADVTNPRPQPTISPVAIEVASLKENVNNYNFGVSIIAGYKTNRRGFGFITEIGADLGGNKIGTGSNRELKLESKYHVYLSQKIGYYVGNTVSKNHLTYMTLGLGIKDYSVSYKSTFLNVAKKGTANTYLIGVGQESKIDNNLSLFIEANHIITKSIALEFGKMETKSDQIKIGFRYYM